MIMLLEICFQEVQDGIKLNTKEKYYMCIVLLLQSNLRVGQATASSLHIRAEKST